MLYARRIRAGWALHLHDAPIFDAQYRATFWTGCLAWRDPRLGWSELSTYTRRQSIYQFLVRKDPVLPALPFNLGLGYAKLAKPSRLGVLR
jgi:hypothetical protein